MSAQAEARTAENAPGALPWAMWGRQLAAILRIELGKSLLGRRAILMYLLALVPIGIVTLMVIFPPTHRMLANPGRATEMYQHMYELLIARAVVFFGCAWIFMNLFRGEIIDRSLHYYFLAPVRRELLVAAKYVAGVLTAIVLFNGATLATLVLHYIPRGLDGTVQHLTAGPGLNHFFSYLGITALACVGYGAVFLVVGLYFRNPIVPALVIYGWEWINFLLPPALKLVSVTHYLQSLSPVPFDEGPLAIVAPPTPAVIAIPGLLVFAAVCIAFAALKARRMEISYGTE